MFKGVFNEDSEGHRLYRHFLLMLYRKVLHRGGFGASSILQQQLANQNSSLDETNKSKLIKNG